MPNTALIIDDEKNIRLTLSRCLSFMKMDVSEAMNGEEGVKKIEEQDYDVIFLDLKMPGMNGLEALKIIKEVRPEASVIMVTAHGTVDAAVEAMKLGAADFMQKPFTPAEVQNIVKEILDRKNLNQDTLESYESFIQYAKDQITRKNYDKAVDFVKKAIALDPDRGEAYNIMGALHEIGGNLEDAKKMYKTTLAIDPGYLQAQRNLVRVTEKLRGIN